MVRPLPRRPSLEQLRHLAKDLLAAYRRGDPVARARLHRWFPEPAPGAPPEPPRLARAQLTIAREYGFPSWARLTAWLARGELPRAPDASVELLGVRDWRVGRAAREALAAAGPDGVAAALAGLSHPSPRVRRGAADFLDHHADDRCVAKLTELALHDPVPYVRRVAVHALLCHRCKPAPLTEDVTPLLVRVAREDPSPRVRTSALWGLGQQRPDPRAVEALAAVLREETGHDLLRAAHQALRRQSPAYREQAARRAREASVARQADAAQPD
jgi:HEAT repeat protein